MVHVVAVAIRPQNNRDKLADKRWKVVHDAIQTGLIGYGFVSEDRRAADVAIAHGRILFERKSIRQTKARIAMARPTTDRNEMATTSDGLISHRRQPE